MRALIFANGDFQPPPALPEVDLIIAADGGIAHCLKYDLQPNWIIGDLDSSDPTMLEKFQANGTRLLTFPQRKDFTDLELAVCHARSLGVKKIWVLGGLGARWDQTLANLLMPAAADFKDIKIIFLDGRQEIHLLHGGASFQLIGDPGDTVSLIPLLGDAAGVSTKGLEYPLHDDTLIFGGTRGISNVLVNTPAGVTLEKGLLVVVLIHH